MSTTSISHSPTSYVAAAAAVLAIAAGGVALSVAHDPGETKAPAQHSSQTSDQPSAPKVHHHPTTSGGHVMLGE